MLTQILDSGKGTLTHSLTHKHTHTSITQSDVTKCVSLFFLLARAEAPVSCKHLLILFIYALLAEVHSVERKDRIEEIKAVGAHLC